jgi:hypothetical protein
MDYLTTESQLNIDYGKVISLRRFNKILFGKDESFCTLEKFVLINAGIIKQINNEYYLLLNKISNYFDLVETQKGELHMPYNYYKNFKQHITDHKYFNIFNTIDHYIEYLDTIGDQFSIFIKSIMFTNELFNGELVDSKFGMYCVKFNKKMGVPLYITFDNDTEQKEGTIAYVGESNYESLYEHHKKCLLMDNPEDFLINNLERVTGNFEFSKMAVQSYLIKNDYQTPLKGLTELITWKDVSLKNEYLDFFIFKYKNIVKVIDGEYMTNFEGLNKFLLNLEVKYLDQWLIKEQINELYYQITHELINSYEILYKERALYA